MCRLDNEENYRDVAFERFWRVTIDQRIEFNTIAPALHYLRVSLNGVILDRLRASWRTKEVPLQWPVFPRKTLLEDMTSSAEIWKRLQRELLNVREQRLTYLLFYGGFNPGEIVLCCSQEFSDVREIFHLRLNIIERILRNVDHLQ